MEKYKIADIVFSAQTEYDYTKDICKDYLYFGEQESEFTAIITKADIDNERVGCPVEYPDCYLESLALFRKICDYGIKYKQAIVFHSSAVSVDGNAYLFTAPSGTGKSTHARLWREMLGDKVVMVNDDKPMIRFVDGAYYVYGTPWTGKHKLGCNMRAKIKALCIIKQSKVNNIEKASSNEMLTMTLNQTVRPTSLEDMDKLLALLDGLIKNVGIYKLQCDISSDASKLSYTVMSKGGNDEN